MITEFFRITAVHDRQLSLIMKLKKREGYDNRDEISHNLNPQSIQVAGKHDSDLLLKAHPGTNESSNVLWLLSVSQRVSLMAM